MRRSEAIRSVGYVGKYIMKIKLYSSAIGQYLDLPGYHSSLTLSVFRLHEKWRILE